MRKASKDGGRLFLLVGNSGSGKDTLIRRVSEGWPRNSPPLYTPRRYITRPPHPSEPYISIEPDAFARMRNRQGFYLDWFSYGIHYGLPGDIADYLQRGAYVLANVSRSVINTARQIFPGTRVIFVKVSYATTAARLQQRGREVPKDIGFEARLLRARKNPILPTADFILGNDGDIQTAVARLMIYMYSQHAHLPEEKRPYFTGVPS
jgi:ribose 1,5-bisphosphokinase